MGEHVVLTEANLWRNLDVFPAVDPLSSLRFSEFTALGWKLKGNGRNSRFG
jgi:hypothetical protein